MPTDADVYTPSSGGFRGLSFNQKPKDGSFVTTIEDINATGVLMAIVDSAFHVSVVPIGGTLAEWKKQGVNSIWTQALLAIGTKYNAPLQFKLFDFPTPYRMEEK